MKYIALALAALRFTSAHASVEQIAGTPTTEHVSEPFSVDFDSKGVLHGVEFTQSNRLFRLLNGFPIKSDLFLRHNRFDR